MKACEKDDTWKPLLLIVPLRLGLSEVNPIYINGLKKSFEMPGSVGMVGGRPNQAHYFIGYVGDEALYLDPHTTQKCGPIGDKLTPSEIEMDETYHQRYASRINFKSMDPSLALVGIKMFLFFFSCVTHLTCHRLLLWARSAFCAKRIRNSTICATN